MSSTATISDLPLNATPPGTSLIEISNAGTSEHTTLTNLSTLYQLITEKGAANGYAPLDGIMWKDL